MECTRLKNGMFVGILEKISRLNPDSRYTGNRYPLYVSLYGQLKKGEPQTVYIAKILYLRIQSITPNARMIQLSKISYGATHQSWSQKIANDQDMVVYALEIKWISMMTNVCVWGVIRGYILCGVGWPIFIFCILNARKKTAVKKKKKNKKKKMRIRRLMLIPSVVINCFWLTRRHVYHTIRYWYSEHHVLGKV